MQHRRVVTYIHHTDDKQIEEDEGSPPGHWWALWVPGSLAFKEFFQCRCSQSPIITVCPDYIEWILAPEKVSEQQRRRSSSSSGLPYLIPVLRGMERKGYPFSIFASMVLRQKRFQNTLNGLARQNPANRGHSVYYHAVFFQKDKIKTKL